MDPRERIPPTIVVIDEDVDLRKAIIAAARAEGCTCEPDIALRGETGHVTVAHEDWCGLIRSRDRN